MADKIQAVGALLLIFVTGFLMAFNLLHVGQFGLDLSYRAVSRFIDGALITLARLVGVAMMGVSLWVIYRIAKS